MSTSRRSTSRGISDEEINDLVSKLQSLLPETPRCRRSSKASATKVLKETCNYIRSLQRDIDGLSEQLSGLMSSMDDDSAQAEIIRTLLR